MQKLIASIQDEMVILNFPLSKTDRENRVVSGFATLDSIDYQGDVITAEASMNAFSKFRGNVRESHIETKAVGRVLNYRQQDFYDTNTNTMYKGIHVDVYVSKGAQDTWEKVLDGTLNGFSVRGPINEKGARTEYNPKLEKVIRYIDNYDLLELSLVDSPCNQMCNVLSIQKNVDGTNEYSGMAVETKTENVFWCDTDGIAAVTTETEELCSKCNESMKNAGWFESVVGEDKKEKIEKVLTQSNLIENNLHLTKGGSDMSDEKEEVTPEVKEETLEKGLDTDAKEETVVVAPEEPDLQGISKVLTEIKDSLAKVSAGNQEKDAALTEIRESVSSVEKGLDAKMKDLLTKHQELVDEFKTFRSNIDTVEKRLGTIESASAIKKSASVSNEEVIKATTKDSVWSGTFLPSNFDQK